MSAYDEGTIVALNASGIYMLSNKSKNVDQFTLGVVTQSDSLDYHVQTINRPIMKLKRLIEEDIYDYEPVIGETDIPVLRGTYNTMVQFHQDFPMETQITYGLCVGIMRKINDQINSPMDPNPIIEWPKLLVSRLERLSQTGFNLHYEFSPYTMQAIDYLGYQQKLKGLYDYPNMRGVLGWVEDQMTIEKFIAFLKAILDAPVDTEDSEE